MNILLLSGGSGTRLWPLSNEVRSKQFIKIFRNGDCFESMLQRMYREIKAIYPDARITVASSENQVPAILSQLGAADISVEPCRRDTFPAIALACAYLAHNGAEEDEPVIVCPVDPYVEKDYFETFSVLRDAVLTDRANLVLLGIEPDYPSEKYGYIIPKTTDAVAEVLQFKEKPDTALAKEYISRGALWNGGVFAFRLKYVLDRAFELLGSKKYEDLFNSYADLTKISFDYAVVEKEAQISVCRFHGKWKDLGTWDTLTEAMESETIGNAVLAECENVHVVNELSIPVVALGLKDAAVAASPDGILVTDKSAGERLKKVVSGIHSRPMYEERSWGSYKVLDYLIHDDSKNSLTKHIVITPGSHISYQYHRHRTEMWTVIEGSGVVIIDGEIRKISRGDTVRIDPGVRHAVKADTEVHIVEVQLGDELTEEDIFRLDFDWSKI